MEKQKNKKHPVVDVFGGESKVQCCKKQYCRNGNLLQCSCLENPRDRGAWWAAIYGVAQSQTRLKRLSSCSSWTVHEAG